MPDPTNPNTPATTASNPMASAPSWDQFVNQYYRAPQQGMIGRQQQTPTFLNPFAGMGMSFGRLAGYNDPSLGWASLMNSGLLNQYGITNAGQFLNYQLSPQGSDRRASGVDIMQQVFRDWQLQQMRQQQQGQPQQQSTEAQAVQPQQQISPAQVLSAFAQVAPVNNPPPLGTYASLLAAMNTPTPPAAQQADPLASWIMQYLRG